MKEQKVEKKAKFFFDQQAKDLFVKELRSFGYDFDKFCIAKKAMKEIKYTVKENPEVFTKLVCIEIPEEEQGTYIRNFVTNTNYFSVTATTEPDFWQYPFNFWSLLKLQSRKEIQSKVWEDELALDKVTGKNHNERALEKIREYRESGLNNLVTKFTTF